QAIADAISNNCSSAGYAVTENNCRLEATLTASNLGCPETEFALGLSNDPTVFDQTGQGPLPDGESDSTTGTTASCTPMPGPVSNLRLATPSDGGGHSADVGRRDERRRLRGVQRHGSERDLQHRGGDGSERDTRDDGRHAAWKRVLSRCREQHLMWSRTQALSKAVRRLRYTSAPHGPEPHPL